MIHPRDLEMALTVSVLMSGTGLCGQVIGVLDGNTIEVLHPQATYDKIKDQIVAKQR